ncbi:pentatricopeptide repeat-containing protein-like isoform X1 [Iris pallida]|uniref:Pentatricopeptide repeat-containing protein-like isoform X1 n=1 Tax=Iris pallida TaxID=29817 RepID=A0AAX6FIR6_IRIPA|nr:pentatricopeptide repeat-containing protein-like isoform X1 [Iris pallida]
MASTTFFSTLLKRALQKTPPPAAASLRSIATSLFSNPRNSSSSSSGPPTRSFTFSFEPEPEPARYEDLRDRIFRLRKRSATAALERWVGEGRKVSQSVLRHIAKELVRSQRYKHALEILTWMESQGNFQITSRDHATRLDLIIKVHGLSDAEAYFEKLPGSASQKAASFPLLHSYVKDRDLEKAEALMLRLHNSALAVDPHLFNEMMKLYMATGQFRKVLDVVRHMKLSNVPFNVLSYNLWMGATAEVSGVSSVETVHKEMETDKNIEVGWSSYCTLANIYTKAGLVDKAFGALNVAEKKISLRKRLAYSFIMTKYAALQDRDGVLRLWESSKKVPERITCQNYMSVMLCLIKIGAIEEAERIFREWESSCRKYDVRVSNVLLGAYMRNGWMEKAESLHRHTLERGAIPNYKTWEILMEGWVKKGKMDRAVDAMRRGFSMLEGCIWRPPSEIVMAIAKHFEDQSSAEDMRRYVQVLQNFGLMNLRLYKSFLRTHINAQRELPDIIKMVESNKIDLDEEARALIQCVEKPQNIDL